jgi:hypothetical protein
LTPRCVRGLSHHARGAVQCAPPRSFLLPFWPTSFAAWRAWHVRGPFLRRNAPTLVGALEAFRTALSGSIL